MVDKCKNCGERIHSTSWAHSPWSHGPLWQNNEPNCPSTTRAEPKVKKQ